MKAKTVPNVGITQLFVKMCKVSVWALQSEYIQITPKKNVEIDESFNDTELANNTSSDEEDHFHQIVCGDNDYIKGIGFEY